MGLGASLTDLRSRAGRLMRRWRAPDDRPGATCEQVAPTRICIEASSFCQLRCPSCPTTSGAIHPAVGSGFLRLTDFRAVLDSAPDLQHVELSNYGEVFLNPQLRDILRLASERGVAVSILNGANLNHVPEDVLEALVTCGVRELSCSIDGASPETYRQYRVRGDFDTVIRNIEIINRYKRQHGSDLPKLRWQFVVFGHNEHEIAIARAKAAELGMEFCAKLTWDQEFSPIRNPDAVRAETGHASRDEYEAERGEPYASYICNQLWDAPQVNWNGKVLGCCRNFWGDFGGNAFADGLAASVNHEKMVHARRMLTGRAAPRADIPCTTCDIYLKMQGRDRFMDRD